MIDSRRLSITLLGAWPVALMAHSQPAEPTDLSPLSWPEGDLATFTALQNASRPPTPPAAVEASQALITGTSSALAIRGGYEALAQGGSAVDAALTTALAQVALVAGSYVSYAGILSLAYYDAAERRVHYMNAGFDTPLGETDPLTIPALGPSGRTALVPGFFAGVGAAHARFGKLPFASLFDPAIYFAERGFEWNARLASYLQARKSVLERLPETRAVFTRPDGELYAAGDWFTQPALVQTLKSVAADGVRTIYEGEWASHFVDAVQREGGRITPLDMSRYQVIWSEPVHTSFRGYDVYSAGLPSLGGVNLVEALNVLDSAGYPARGDYASDPEALFWFMQVQRLMLLGFLTPEQQDAVLPGVELSPASRTTPATASALWDAMQAGSLPYLNAPDRLSTHSDAVVAIDARGNIAALTHTINTTIWGQTGLFVDGISIPDAAFFQQQRMLDTGPGQRLPEELDPTIVLENGCPLVASSSIGVTHYRTLPLLYGMLGFDRGLESAARRPYLLLPDFSRSAELGVVERVTTGLFPNELLDGVRALGQAIEVLAPYAEAEHLGYVVGVERDAAAQRLRGIPAPYLNGVALGY